MPTITYFAPASNREDLLALAEVTASNDGAAPAVDVKDYDGDLMVVLYALNTAGTDPELDVKLQAAPDASPVDEVAYSGTGTGTCTQIEGGPDTVAEDITITFSNATTAAVVGSVSGALGTATVGTKFTSPYISFMLTAGGTAFVNTDAFTVTMLDRDWADIDGAAFETVTDAESSVQRISLDADRAGRYLRAHTTVAGTDTPKFHAGVSLFGINK